MTHQIGCAGRTERPVIDRSGHGAQLWTNCPSPRPGAPEASPDKCSAIGIPWKWDRRIRSNRMAGLAASGLAAVISVLFMSLLFISLLFMSVPSYRCPARHVQRRRWNTTNMTDLSPADDAWLRSYVCVQAPSPYHHGSRGRGPSSPHRRHAWSSITWGPTSASRLEGHADRRMNLPRFTSKPMRLCWRRSASLRGRPARSRCDALGVRA